MDVDDISHEEMAEREEDQKQKPEEGVRGRKGTNQTDSMYSGIQLHPLLSGPFPV